MFGLTYLKNVTTLEYNSDRCTGCTLCTQVCPHEVFIMNDKKAELANPDLCMECGACALNCREEAISVKSGVGCAWGIINGIIRGTEPTCGCGDESGSGSCC
jgi:NAD-dependent dihydropyrimidine dehydrogenase PreA subunit